MGTARHWCGIPYDRSIVRTLFRSLQPLTALNIQIDLTGEQRDISDCPSRIGPPHAIMPAINGIDGLQAAGLVTNSRIGEPLKAIRARVHQSVENCLSDCFSG